MMTKDALRYSIFVMMVLLLSFAVLTQHQLSLQQQPLSQSSLIPSLAYADKIKLKNKLHTNDISDQPEQQQQSPKSLSSSSPQVGSILPLPSAVQQQPMNNKKILTATARGIPNQFIIVLKDSLESTTNSNTPSTLSIPSQLIPKPESATKAIRDISQQAISMGARVQHIFDSVIHGFTVRVANQQVIDVLAKDPRVAYIEQDQRVKVFQTLPTGINRIDADLSPTHSGDGRGNVDADIAILDTGIDLSHPDLNIYVQKTFVSGTSSANDDNGHGTHVAGIAAAKDNGYGVVGVAPGARLWAIKVIDSTGSGFISTLISGIDYIAKYSSQVDVANLSLGCECKSSALDTAINNAVAKGLTFVVAAGNDHTDASTLSPANNPNVIAVSAIADSDGKCGGRGPSTSYGHDDSFAGFSNYGSIVDMAAPGVHILSTYKGKSYAYMTGTSMAASHVTGAAALYKGMADPSASPSAVKSALQNQGSKPSTVCDGNGHGYFTDDPDSYHEPLLYARYL
jgi:subtilisin